MWAEQEQNRAWLWLYPRQGYEFRTVDDGDPYNEAGPPVPPVTQVLGVRAG